MLDTLTRHRRRIGTLARIAIGIAILLVILRTAELDALGRSLLQFSPIHFLAAVAIFAADRLLMAYKWARLLDIARCAVPLARCVRIYLVGGAVGLLLPATVGLDAVRLDLVRREGVPTEFAFGSIVVERVLGILATAGLAVLGTGLLVSRAPAVPDVVAAGALGAAGAAAAIVLLILFNPRLARHAAAGARTNRIGLLLDRAAEGFRPYRAQHAGAFAVFLLSVLEQLLHVLIAWTIAAGLGLQIGPLDCLAVVPPVLLLGRIPISIEGIGVREGLYVLFFGFLGVPTADSASLAILIRLVLLTAAVPGVVLLLRSGYRRHAPDAPLHDARYGSHGAHRPDQKIV